MCSSHRPRRPPATGCGKRGMCEDFPRRGVCEDKPSSAPRRWGAGMLRRVANGPPVELDDQCEGIKRVPDDGSTGASIHPGSPLDLEPRDSEECRLLGEIEIRRDASGTSAEAVVGSPRLHPLHDGRGTAFSYVPPVQQHNRCYTQLQEDVNQIMLDSSGGDGGVELLDSSSEEQVEGPGTQQDTPARAELQRVDVAQQGRLLQYFETLAAQRRLACKASASAKGHGRGKARPKTLKGRGKGDKSTSPQASRGQLLHMLGGSVKQAVPASAKSRPAKRRFNTRNAAAKRRRSNPPTANDGTKPEAGSGADPKLPGEKRPSRYVPRPSKRVQERIERALNHRLYLLARRTLPADKAASCSGVQLDILGSTGNVYHVKLHSSGCECSCLDFAKAGGVCKHLLFVTLRVLRLPSDDYRVWQTSYTRSELQPIVARLGSDTEPNMTSELPSGVQADAVVLRGYRQALGDDGQQPTRRPLPADCPICFEEMLEAPEGSAAAAAIVFCRTCGHNVHADCQCRWAAVASAGNVCPMCRSPWTEAAAGGSASDGPVNLAAYSAEHRNVALAELYPETHRWITRRDGQQR
eukprot:gnl/TRDRNA2_/TRDRNA2_136194_c1_seq1.p1 gnl/TRDRNA2_/TRDRNA2_136194_c1~~gnl/TRDRNA2_/TRDRNA2_136194_c1_seq1.p1  ORF type:complete len:581 (+),score=77.73 gnl/TRDRNA2_/TRDRNA2_136194_c1_seq1:704-2446(+)